MSRNPAKKMIAAPRKNLPTAKLAAAPKFTTSPRNVRTLGLIPVAAIAPTILSSSHLLPVPIAPVSVAIFRWDRQRPDANAPHLSYRRLASPANSLDMPNHTRIDVDVTRK